MWTELLGDSGLGFRTYVALRSPTKGKALGTYSRNIREGQRVKGLRSKLSPKEGRLLPNRV